MPEDEQQQIQDNEIKPIETEDKPSVFMEYFLSWRRAIIVFLVCLLVFLAFRFGVNYSCQDGMLLNDRCVSPNIVDTITVCEIKGDCSKVCADVTAEAGRKLMNELEIKNEQDK